MFYSQFILAKKGPLGTIWIAAHLERKLRKNQISDTDIGVSVDSILSPDVPIALRLSSHLLLGVVRIYSKKVNYLFDDCSEALLKVKQAFRSTAVDLPPEESKAPYHSITLPETFDLDDFELPETELFQGNFVDHHVSSKEQITLQDTMDSVVYSASQYGLDERFGDGEASQIGLDLDEELLFSKGSPSGHGVLLTSRVDPEALFEPSSPQNCDELDDEVHEPIQAVATNCNIEAPTTPGLVEAPNVHCTEGVLVSDDHMEVDNNPSHVEYGNGTNGCAFETQQIEKSTPQVESPSTAEPMELIESSNVAHINGSDMVCEVSNGLHVECVQNVSLGVSVLDGGLAVNCTRECEEAQETGINESTVLLSDSHNHPSPSEERGSHHDKSSVIGFESVSENTSLVDNSTLGPETEAETELRISSNSENKGGQNLSGPEASEIWNADAKADTMSVYKPILQPCNIRTNEENAEFGNVLPVLNLPSKDIGVGSEGMAEKEDVSEVYVAKEQDVHDMSSKEGHLLDTTTPFSRIDEQPEISENVRFQKGNDSVASELPSPEKMLSLPDVPINQSNRLFEGSTPEREVLVQGDHDAIMNQLSGKKRSLTESTMALQTFNSVESSEAAQTKRSVDFIPGDDDLLSSILVGRQSTALKVKSTPPAYDMASSKRPRATPRSGAHKRKVIVDDSMVLHGDTIRQQLMSTEDIRRVRKKAPSTHPEIWILQKQFLEDEIFKDPIFTGMSAKLVTLHCHPFKLSEIKLVQDDGRRDQTATDIIGSEIKLVQDDGRKDQTTSDIIGTPARPTMGEELEFDGTSVLSAGKDESRQQSIECSYDTPAPSSIRVSLDLGSTPENERKNDSEGGHTPSQFDISENRTEIETECRREPVADEADHSVALGVESSSSHPSVFEHHDNLINSDVIQPSCLKDISDAGVSDQVDRSCLRLDEQVSVRDTFPVDDTPVVVGMEDVDSTIHTTDGQPDSSLPVNDENIIVEDRISDEGRTHEPGTVREFPESELNFDHEDLSFNHQKEDLNIDSSDPAFDGFDLQNQFSKSQIFMDINATASDDPTLGNFSTHDLEADAIEHDTDFLNFDDDEIAEEDDNYMPDTEGPHVLDNSGWSTRTRGVANYLQVLFHKAAQQGRTDLHLDNLLANKTRKEASRMFFETLVLKTRDYIHVDQPSPFDNVSVKPRARLLKSEFR